MTDPNEISKADLLRYFTGDDRLSPEEEERIGAWLEEHPDWKSLLNDQEESIDWETEAEFRVLQAKMDRSADRSPDDPERSPHERPARKKRSTRRMASRVGRVLGVLALMAVSAVLALTFWGDLQLGGGGSSSMREVATDPGQRAQVRLADGTQVMLNVDSELRIPTDLDEAGSVRDVYLDGEAYFEVSSNPERPFRVHSGGTVTRVLGTAFSVRAYPGEGGRVVVEEGSVSVQVDRDVPTNRVSLSPRQVGEWSASGAGALQVAENVDVDGYLSWREGRLRFDGASLAEVTGQLERWYDIDIRLADSSMTTRSFTGTFEGATPVREVLDTFTFATGLRYQKEARRVVLRPE